MSKFDSRQENEAFLYNALTGFGTHLALADISPE
jgi:hypothetical protein